MISSENARPLDSCGSLGGKEVAVGEIDAAKGEGVAVDGNGVGGMMVVGTAVGGTGVGGKEVAVGEIDAALGEGVAVDDNGVGGMVVGGIAVGGTSVGRTAVGRTPVGEAAVGGTSVGGNDVGGTVGGLGASATDIGCFCVPEGSSASVGPHPIAIIAINTRTISFTVMRHLCSLAPSNAVQRLRLEYYKVLPSNYRSGISVPLDGV